MRNKTKRPRRGRRILWIIVASVVGAVLLAVAVGYVLDAPGRNEVAALNIGDVEMADLQDGVYVGAFAGTKGSLRDVTVAATLEDGRLTTVRVVSALDDDGNPSAFADGGSMTDLFDAVIDAQSLQVDAVTGATLTSKAHLKALENALTQAQSTGKDLEGDQ